MIRARLHRDEAGAYTGFTCSGHSGYAESGADIVCAGVSALTIACVNALEADAGVEPLVATDDDGFLSARLPQRMTEAQRHDAQLLLSALHTGLACLADSYPAYVQVLTDNRRETP